MGRIKRVAWWPIKYLLIGLLHVLDVVIRAIIYISMIYQKDLNTVRTLEATTTIQEADID